ncbi:MAG TPA: alpha/beta fold hydrolase [Caldimonas sp.]|nr:alpha/beta fold hydrolase [Caldimonas sp.]
MTTSVARGRPDAGLWPVDVTHRHVDANGIRLHVALAGPDDGPLVLLLHGFPEGALCWREQVEPLVRAGWRVAVPDQRGYGTSSKPASAHAYALNLLARDAIDLAAALGHDRAAVVGHDWGGVVAWHLLTHHARFVQRAVVLNAPHPATMLGHALTHPSQALKSAYVAFFQLPWLPEASLEAGHHALLRRTLTSTSRPGAFDDALLDAYAAAWSEPGALTAMLNWYRALAFAPRLAPQRITVPVRIVWGDRDAALDAALAERAAGQCDLAEVVHLPECTHWLLHEDAERVNELIVEFLAAACPA